MNDENKLYVMVNYTNKQSYIGFDELQTFGEFKESIKNYHKIKQNFTIYSENAYITLNYDDKVTMSEIIEAKALYNLDELTIRLVPKESSFKWLKNILLHR